MWFFKKTLALWLCVCSHSTLTLSRLCMWKSWTAWGLPIPVLWLFIILFTLAMPYLKKIWVLNQWIHWLHKIKTICNACFLLPSQEENVLNFSHYAYFQIVLQKDKLFYRKHFKHMLNYYSLWDTADKADITFWCWHDDTTLGRLALHKQTGIALSSVIKDILCKLVFTQDNVTMLTNQWSQKHCTYEYNVFSPFQNFKISVHKPCSFLCPSLCTCPTL